MKLVVQQLRLVLFFFFLFFLLKLFGRYITMLLRALMNGSMLSGSSGGSLAPRALRRLATVLTASLALQAVPPVTGLAAALAWRRRLWHHLAFVRTFVLSVVSLWLVMYVFTLFYSLECTFYSLR